MRPLSRRLLCLLFLFLVSCGAPEQSANLQTSVTIYVGQPESGPQRIGRQIRFEDVDNVTIDVLDSTSNALVHDNTSLQRYGNLWSTELGNLNVGQEIIITGYALSNDVPPELLFHGETSLTLQPQSNSVVVPMEPVVPESSRDFPRIVGIARPDTVLVESTQPITVMVEASANDNLSYDFTVLNDTSASFQPDNGSLLAVEGVNLLTSQLTVGNQTGSQNYQVLLSNQDGLAVTSRFDMMVSNTLSTSPSLALPPTIQRLTAERITSDRLKWVATVSDDKVFSELNDNWTFSLSGLSFDNLTENSSIQTFSAELTNFSDNVVGQLTFSVTDNDSLQSSLDYFLREGLFPQNATLVLFSERQLLTSGEDFSCAVLANGSVQCWGRNDHGQLGNGQLDNASTPQLVLNLSGVREVSAGSYHACGLKDDGTVRCWGANDFGQLGNGTGIDSSSPVNVQNLSNVRQISAGAQYACALHDNGSVSCWGANSGGQLGNGTDNNSSSPVNVQNLSTVRQIQAAQYHSCALTDNGSVYCWGANSSGQLGDGSTISQNYPTVVPGLTDVIDLFVANTSGASCAKIQGGTAICWGANSSGQLGLLDHYNRLRPQVVPRLENVRQMGLGTSHSCALYDNGTVTCWGTNDSGQRGNGNNDNITYVSGAISTLNLLSDTVTNLQLNGTSPVDNASSNQLKPTLAMHFNEVLRPSTASVSADSSCSGSFQLSNDNFSSCIPLNTITLADNGSSISTTPISNLNSGHYQWRVTTALQDAFGNSLSDNRTIAFTANTLSGGEGTEASPFLISNQVELSLIRERLDKHYRLTNNITLSGIWEPIGDNDSHKFTGSLDGDHFLIDNLSSTDNFTIAAMTDNFGLFGVLGGNSRISDLFLKGTVKAHSNVGLLAGKALDNTTIENVHAEGNIEGLGDNTGGLVGFVDNTTTIKKTLAAVNISGIVGTTNAGGLVGLLKAGSVEESTALGSISYGENVGGLVGKLESGATLKNSYARGAVAANDNISGGLVGYNGGTVETSYSTGPIGGIGQQGGLIGVNTGTVSKSYWNNLTSGMTTSAGQGTDNSTGFASDNMTQQVVAGTSGQLYYGWDNTSIWHLQNQYDYPRLRWQFFAASVGFASGSDNESIQQSDNLSIVFSKAVDNTTLTYSGTNATIKLTQFSPSNNETFTAYLSADNQTLTIDPDNTTLGNNYYLTLNADIQALDGQRFIQSLQVPLLVDNGSVDSDNDNLTDYEEAITYGTNPNNADSDGDGLNDYLEVTGWQFSYRTVDNNIITKTVYSDPTSVDTDGDGLNDSLEYTGWSITYYDSNRSLNTVTTKSDPSSIDSDQDGLSDYYEYYYPYNSAAYSTYTRLDAANADTDHDNMTDGNEVNGILSSYTVNGYSYSFWYTSNPRYFHTDSDNLSDYLEFVHGTWPYSDDSDGDLLDDYSEIFGTVITLDNGSSYTVMTNPRDWDTDDDSLRDGNEVNGYYGSATATTEGGSITFQLISDPTLRDTDNDSINDYDEYVSTGSNSYITNPSSTDTDLDGLSDFYEVKGKNPDGTDAPYKSDPTDWDSDNDSFSDLEEKTDYSTNPNSSSSKPLDLNSTDSGLIAYYRFNNDASDSAGGDDNGTVDGATFTTDRFGSDNSSIKFLNSGDKVIVSHRPALDLVDNFTISAWFKTNSTATSNKNILSKCGGSSCRTYLRINNDNRTESLGLISSEVSPGTWTLVTVTTNNSVVTIYVNGVLKSANELGSLDSNSDDISIGYSFSDNTSFDGDIDDVRIYNRPLSLDEIESIYAVTSDGEKLLTEP